LKHRRQAAELYWRKPYKFVSELIFSDTISYPHIVDKLEALSCCFKFGHKNWKNRKNWKTCL